MCSSLCRAFGRSWLELRGRPGTGWPSWGGGSRVGGPGALFPLTPCSEAGGCGWCGWRCAAVMLRGGKHPNSSLPRQSGGDVNEGAPSLPRPARLWVRSSLLCPQLSHGSGCPAHSHLLTGGRVQLVLHHRPLGSMEMSPAHRLGTRGLGP